MPLVDISPYPPAPPSISTDVKSVSVFLQNSPYVQRRLQDLTNQRFIADIIFGRGPAATGGAVQYDQLTAADLFLSREIQPIEPGGEYAWLTAQQPTPSIAAVSKWGGRLQISDEALRRQNFNVVERELTKLGNNIVRKVDAVAIATLTATSAKLTYAFSATWSGTPAGILPGLLAAKLQVDQQDMGYTVDTLVLNPAQATTLLSYEITAKLLGETAQADLVRTGYLGNVLGLDIFQSNRVTAGTGHLLQRGVVGSISDEVPLASKTYREEHRDTTVVQGGRIFVPYVTDPKAYTYLTGLA